MSDSKMDDMSVDLTAAEWVCKCESRQLRVGPLWWGKLMALVKAGLMGVGWAPRSVIEKGDWRVASLGSTTEVRKDGSTGPE